MLPIQSTDPWAANAAYLAAQQRLIAEQELERERQAALAAEIAAPPAAPVAAPAAAAPAAPAATSGFEDFLTQQADIPGVESLDAWKAAPADVRAKLLRTGMAKHMADSNMPLEQRAEFMRTVQAKYEAMVPKSGAYGTNNFLNGAADLGASLAGGAVGAIKSIADLAGNDNPVSKFLGDVGDALAMSKSDESKRKAEWVQARISEAYANGHTGEAVAEWVRGALDRPGETIANLAGSFVTLGFGKAAQLLGAGAKAAMGVTATAGAAQGAGAVRQQIYDRTLADAKANGMGDEAAAAVAQRAAELGQAAPALAAGAALGALAGSTGAEAALLRGAAATASRGIVPAAASLAKAGAVEAGTEGAQQLQQGLAGNEGSALAGQRDPTNVLTPQVVGDTVIAGLQGLIAGGGVRALQGANSMLRGEPTGQIGAGPTTAAAVPGQTAPVDPGTTTPITPTQQAAAAPGRPANEPGGPPAGQTIETVRVPGELDTWAQVEAHAPVMTEGQKAETRKLLDAQGFVTARQLEDLGVTLQDSVRTRNIPSPESVAPPMFDPEQVMREAQRAALPSEVRQAIITATENGTPMDARDLMGHVRDDPNASETERSIAGWMQGLLGEHAVLGKKPVSPRRPLAKGTVRAGTYNSGTGEITLDPVHGMTRHAVLHETAHAVTLHYMRAPAESLLPNQLAARDEITKIYNHVLQQSPELKVGLYLPNPVEFIAQALSDARVQNKLRTVAWGPAQSTWARIVSTLRGLVGMSENVASDTAWAALLDAADNLTLPDNAALMRPMDGGEILSLDAGEAPANKDAMFARLDSDAKGTLRGMARYDPSTGQWQATWHSPTGGTLVRTGPSIDWAKAWLEDRGAKPGTSGARASVVTYQSNSSQAGLLRGPKTALESIAPGASGFMRAMSRLSRGTLSDSQLLSLGRQAAGLWQGFVGRYSSTNALREAYKGSTWETLLGENSIIRRVAEGRADRSNPGFAGNDSWFDVRSRAAQHRASMRAAGVADGVASDWAYAYAAAQVNASRAAQYPTDAAGRAKQDAQGLATQDFAKFSYYQDAAGRILDVPHGATVPIGATLVDGDTAPAKFIAQFQRQYTAEAITAGNRMLDSIRQGNAHVLRLQLANGAISTKDFQAMMAMPLWLPMRQTEQASRGGAKAATGRTSKALDPMAQWVSVNEARLEAAQVRGALLDLMRALRENPQPQLATLNSSSVKLAPSTALNPNLSTVELMRDGWLDDRSVSVYDGNTKYTVTFAEQGHAPLIAKAFKGGGLLTTEEGQFIIDKARMMTHWLAFVRTGLSPKFMAMQVGWDGLTAMVNAQGAFKGINSGSDLTNGQAAKLALKILPTAAANVKAAFLRGLETNGVRATQTAVSPMRKFYDASGGGIHMDARGQFLAMRNVLMGETASPGARVKAGSKDVMNSIGALGHAFSDAIRFTAFESYMVMRNGGTAFTSEAQIRNFAQANPDVVEAAVIGSKNLLGNFERAGQVTVLRAVIPFFNAGIVGTTQVLPQILGSAHGRRSVSLLAGAGFLTALAAMSDDNDKTADGYSKYLDSANAWKSLNLFGIQVPVPPELWFMVWGVNAAAAMATAQDGHAVDTDRLVKEGWDRIKDFSPIRPAPFEDAPFETALGIFSPLVLAYNGRDQFGKPLMQQEPRAGGRTLVMPDHLRGRPTDAMWLHDLAGAANDASLGAVDVAPGTFKLWIDHFTGAGSQMFEAGRKGMDAEAAGQDTSAMNEVLTWVGSSWALKENTFAPIEREREAIRHITGQVARDADGNSLLQLQARSRQLQKLGDTAGAQEYADRAQRMRDSIDQALRNPRDPQARGQSLF